MSVTLTQEQKARIFAMYLGCDFIYENGEPETLDGVATGICYTPDADESGEGICGMDDCKLILTPLSRITDEDAIEVAEIYADTLTEKADNNKKVSEGKYLTKLLSGEKSDSKWNMVNILQCYQYLISRSYAVPMFIEPEHPGNGLTPIELNLAIEKQ